MAIVLSGTTGIDAGSLPVNNCGNTEVEGNLNLSGVGARITGDFSNATLANRVIFQTSTSNSNTIVSAIPNGTATESYISTRNNSDAANASGTSLGVTAGVSIIDATKTGTGAYLPLVFATSATERVRIDTTGNVGIGVIPSAWQSGIKVLDIGNACIQYGGGTNFEIGVNYYANIGYKYKSTGYASKYYQQDGQHWWYTAPSGTAGNAIPWNNAMALDSSGYLYFGGDIADATTTGIRRGSAGQLIFRASSGGLYQQVGANYYLVTTSGGSTSDITLKKDIKVIPNSLNKILNLKGVYYEFIEEQLCTADKGKQIGVIAQDVEQEFPEIVLTNEDGIKTVRYDRLIAPMIEAIKEQNEIIKDLKSRIEILESK